MAVKNFVGGVQGYPDDMDQAANWDPAGLPDALDTATISNPVAVGTCAAEVTNVNSFILGGTFSKAVTVAAGDDATISGGTFTGTLTLAAACSVGGVTAQDILVTNTSGTVTLTGALSCRSWTHNGSGGTVDYASKTITINGASGVECVKWTAGTTSNAGTFAIASSCSGQWDNAIGTNLSVPAGVTFTLSGTFTADGVAVAGIIAGGAKLMWIPTTNNAWTQTGSIACGMFEPYAAGTTTHTGTITITPTSVLLDQANADLTVGGLLAGSVAMQIYGSGTGNKLTVTGPLVVGNVTLGNAGGTRIGKLTLGTTATMGTVARTADNTATTHQFNLGSCKVTATGAWTLAGIAVNLGSGAIGGVGAITINGASATSVANTGARIRGCVVNNLTLDSGPPVEVRHGIIGTGNDANALRVVKPVWPVTGERKDDRT